MPPPVPPATLFDAIQRLDERVLHWITCDLHREWIEGVFLQSQSKHVVVPILLATIGALAFWRPQRALRCLFTSGIAWCLAMLLASLLWMTVDRPRPQKVYAEILRTPEELATCAAHPEALALRTGGSSRPSFPSRHGLTIGVFATALWLAWRRLGAVAILWGVVAAVGRVYAGKHWPSDVLVGVLLGIPLAWATWRSAPAILGLVGRRAWVEDPPDAGPADADGKAG